MSTTRMSDSSTVSIGQAAALYGLAPSTLRWWESQGVLPKPPRDNGRRVYSETELRRIGLAYLCCVTGAMPLDRTAIVTCADKKHEWRSTVQDEVRRIEEKIHRLQGAREYLLHLVRCPAGDLVAECTHLTGELIDHTPRGRSAAPDLVTAARSAPGTGTAASVSDELGGPRYETQASTQRCAVCAGPLTRPARGRHRRYCSPACRQRHYRQAKNRRR